MKPHTAQSLPLYASVSPHTGHASSRKVFTSGGAFFSPRASARSHVRWSASWTASNSSSVQVA